MKIDSSLVVLSVAVPAGKPFHFLNFAVDTFPHGVRDPVFSIGYDIIDMRFQALGGLDDWAHSGVRGPEIPPSEVFPHPAFPVIVPQVSEVILDSASTANFEIQ